MSRHHAPKRRNRLPSLDSISGSSVDALGLGAERPTGPAAGDGRAGRPVPGFNRVGSRRYLQAAAALFLAGFATFSLLYCVQPLLPTLARAFGVGAAASSLAISVTTGLLALSIVAAASLSDLWGRKPVMAGSLALAAACNAAAAIAPSWSLFLGLRALEGIALGGVPAVAMTYLAEETEPAGLGLAMGLYVGSTAVGGMGGRVIAGLIAAATSWRVAVGLVGLAGLVLALAFVLLLPASRHFRRRPVDPAGQARAFAAALRRPALLALYAFGFLIMGGFVALYNYAGFRLEAPPYGLDQAQQGLIFTLYLLGTVSSTLAGALADRFGRAPVMAAASLLALGGVFASLFVPLAALVLGIALVTLGFFAGHAVASGSVGGLAGEHKGQTASLYLLSYYAGSSLLGTAGGWFWSLGRWSAVAGFLAVLFGLALSVAVLVRWLEARS
jgi:YNFM family putative membrane transporter